MTPLTEDQRCEHLQLTKCDNDGDGTFYWICVEPGCDFSTPMQNADDGSWYELTRSTDETTERRIIEPIKVGVTLFRPGVRLQVVLDRIERGFTQPSVEGKSDSPR